MDFEKGTITQAGDSTVIRVKVNRTNKYDTDRGWVVVVYMDVVGSGNMMELVWPEYGKPYLQQITPSKEGGVDIARMILSPRPKVATDEEILDDLLRTMGAF